MRICSTQIKMTAKYNTSKIDKRHWFVESVLNGTNIKYFHVITKQPFGAECEKKVRKRSFEKDRPIHEITCPCKRLAIGIVRENICMWKILHSFLYDIIKGSVVARIKKNEQRGRNSQTPISMSLLFPELTSLYPKRYNSRNTWKSFQHCLVYLFLI